MSHKYQLIRVLGRGTFGQACLVRRKGAQSSTERNLVVKKIELRTLCEKDLDQALTEVAILARCKHTNVIRYCEAFVENGLLHVVMEFADGGKSIVLKICNTIADSKSYEKTVTQKGV